MATAPAILAAPPAEARLLTADEFAEMNRLGRSELIRGKVHKLPPPQMQHGWLASEIGWRLGEFVHQHQLGRTFAAETGFLIAQNPDTVRAPDASFIRADRLPETMSGYFPGGPDLAVEVVSPSDTWSELLDKVSDWLAAGTRMVWVVDGERQRALVFRSMNDVHTLTGSQALDGQDVLPGFSLPLSELFAR